jgi:predicted ATP-grasp superfamily ATP-dependent carboligase
MGSIACIRSLGSAGHEVLAMSHQMDALGFRSRHAARRILLPRGASRSELAQTIRSLVDQHCVDLVLPSEGLVNVLGDRLHELADRMPCGPDPATLQRYMSKHDLFVRFLGATDLSLREHLPATVLLDSGSNLRVALDDLRPPLFAKFDSSPANDLSARVERITTMVDALQRLPQLLDEYGRCVVQEWVPGQGVGVFFLRWNGRILGELMHRRLHEVPHTGGVSSLRETWWDAQLHADALKRIEAMDWWGVGMLEYRYNGPGRFYLMEFNARFWGSLHLALFAGVDFPCMLVDAWQGKAVEPRRAAEGVRCRYTFPKELEYLWSVIRDHDVPSDRKLKAVLEVAWLGLDPRVRSDLWFPGDRRLYWRALARTPAHFLQRS